MGIQTNDEAQTTHGTAGAHAGSVTLFGVPIGDLGWFASLLMGTATAFAAFFAATFVGIVFIMVWNSMGRGTLDYSFSYMRLGLPVGILVLVVSLGYLGSLWVRRMTRSA
jgi:uncharacterized membrane protein YphA (DoxX/SURF4 family)